MKTTGSARNSVGCQGQRNLLGSSTGLGGFAEQGRKLLQHCIGDCIGRCDMSNLDSIAMQSQHGPHCAP